MMFLQQIDAAILLFIQENLRIDAMNGIWKFVTFLGDGGWFWIALSLVLMIPKKTRRIGVASMLSIAFCALITNILIKNIVARPRPFDAVEAIVPLINRPWGYSFPSGHTCASFASALILLRMAPKRYGVAAVVLATLIGFSRMYVGVHYPGDVMAGFLVALFGSAVIYRWVEKKDICYKGDK